MRVTAIDCETVWISRPGEVPKLVCVSYAEGNSSGVTEAERAEEYIHSVLDGGGHMVFHNAPFDVTVLAKAYPSTKPKWWKAYKDRRIHDTAVRQQLIDHAVGHPCHAMPGLAKLAERAELGELDKDTDIRGGYDKLIGVPAMDYPPAFYEYARKDAETTLKVYEAQLDGSQYLQAEPFQVFAHFCLYLGTLRGFTFDLQRVEEIRKEAQDAVAACLPSLYRQGMIELVPTNPEDMYPGKPIVVSYKRRDEEIRARVAQSFSKAGREPPKTPSGEVSTKEFSCKLSGNPTLKKYAEYTSWQNLLDNDMAMFDAAIDKDMESIHCRVNPLLVTGRISTTRPNMQNKRSSGPIRSAFVARPSFRLATVDYSMAELHTLAQINLDLFGESAMAEVLRKGRDLHSAFGVELAKHDGKTVTYEKFVKLKDGPTYKPYRKMAKIVNFGLGGGMGAPAFVKHAMEEYEIYLTVEEAKALKKLWLKTFPEMALFFERASQDQGTTMEIPRTGRSAATIGWDKKKKKFYPSYTQACNYKFQGLASDGMKAAWIALTEACYFDKSSVLYGSRPIIPIHDEAIVEVKEGVAEECLKEIGRIMSEEFNVYTPDVPVRTEGRVMDRWSK